MVKRPLRILASLLMLGVGCDDPNAELDGGTSDAGAPDAAVELDAGKDAGAVHDAATQNDAGANEDAGTDADAGSGLDAAAPDAAAPDAAADDAGSEVDASTDVSITVQISAGAGVVTIEPNSTAGLTFCTEECTVAVAPGEGVTLTMSSPSAFAGWGGACSGDSRTCQVTVDGATTVSAAFELEPSGEWSLFLPDDLSVDSLAFDDEGNLLLANVDELYKFSSAGAELWMVQLPADVSAGGGMGVDSAGNVYIRTATKLLSYDAAGNARWTRTVSAGGGNPEARDLLVVSADDAIAVISGGNLYVYDVDGDVLWSDTTLPDPRAIDATSNGNILVAVAAAEPFDEQCEVRVFSPLGMPLTPLSALTTQYTVWLSVAPDDSVIASSSGHSNVYVSWLSPDDPLVVTHVDSGAYTSHAVIVDSLGRPVTMHTGDYEWMPGTLRVLDVDGDIVFERSHDVGDWYNTSVLPYALGVLPAALAADSSGRFAVAGRFQGDRSTNTWLGVYKVE